MKYLSSGLWLSLSIGLISVVDADAQGLNRDELRLYGGTYMTNCGNNSAPRVTISANSVTVSERNRRVTGSNVQAAHGFFGRGAPPDFLVAIVSEVRSEQIYALIHKDRAGQYAKFDADTKIRANFSAAMINHKFRHCDGAAASAPAPVNTPPTAPPPPANSQSAAPPPSGSLMGSAELLRDSTFRSAYYAALGGHASEDWLNKLDGPAPAPRRIRVSGTEYQVISVCKNSDCSDNNAVLLYSAAQHVVYGKLLIRRRGSLIGNPPVAVASELDRLWAAEWRQRR